MGEQGRSGWQWHVQKEMEVTGLHAAAVFLDECPGSIICIFAGLHAAR